MDSINNDNNNGKDNLIEAISRYSQIVNNTKECVTVKILRKILNSINGEMTNINTYLYQLFLINEKNSDIYMKLKDIININLLIIEQLGNAIKLFGANPKFVNNSGNFWSARYIKYIDDFGSFINKNINRERDLLQTYEKNISLITNESLKVLFSEIILSKKYIISVLEDIK